MSIENTEKLQNYSISMYWTLSHFFRCGIALALNKLSQYLEESQVTPLFLFFVPDALNDRHAEVRRCMLDAALSALNTHGKVCALPSPTPYTCELYFTVWADGFKCALYVTGQCELTAAGLWGVS